MVAASCGFPELPPLPVRLELVAGAIDGAGHEDGCGDTARFSAPGGVAVDEDRNIYVADSANRAIRKITPDRCVSTLPDRRGPLGYVAPGGVAVDSIGNLYIADAGAAAIVQMTIDDEVRTIAGRPGDAGCEDGAVEQARFNYPLALALEQTGNLYVADTDNQVLRTITGEGSVTTLSRADGQSCLDVAVRFGRSKGVAVGITGDIYVADYGFHAIYKITSDGMMTTLAGRPGDSGHVDDAGAGARFSSPTGVAVDRSGNVYVADTGNAAIRKITPIGITTTVVAEAVEGDPALMAPYGLAIDGDSLIISDANAVLRLRRAVQ